MSVLSTLSRALPLGLVITLVACAAEPSGANTPSASVESSSTEQPRAPLGESHASDGTPASTEPAGEPSSPVEEPPTCESLASGPPAGAFTAEPAFIGGDTPPVDVFVTEKHDVHSEGHQYTLMLTFTSMKNPCGYGEIGATPAKSASKHFLFSVVSPHELADPFPVGTYHGGGGWGEGSECTADSMQTSGIGFAADQTITITKRSDAGLEGTWSVRTPDGKTVLHAGTFRAPFCDPPKTVERVQCCAL